MELNIWTALLAFAAYFLLFKVLIRLRIREPSNNTERLHKLVVMTKKHEYDYFEIAAKEHYGNLVPKDRVITDYKKWLAGWGKEEHLPQYLIMFLEDGKDHIDNAHISLIF